MPELKYGQCPWCKLDRMLTFAMGSYNGQMWSDFICFECLNTKRAIKIGSLPCFTEEE